MGAGEVTVRVLGAGAEGVAKVVSGTAGSRAAAVRAATAGVTGRTSWANHIAEHGGSAR